MVGISGAVPGDKHRTHDSSDETNQRKPTEARLGLIAEEHDADEARTCRFADHEHRGDAIDSAELQCDGLHEESDGSRDRDGPRCGIEEQSDGVEGVDAVEDAHRDGDDTEQQACGSAACDSAVSAESVHRQQRQHAQDDGGEEQQPVE